MGIKGRLQLPIHRGGATTATSSNCHAGVIYQAGSQRWGYNPYLQGMLRRAILKFDNKLYSPVTRGLLELSIAAGQSPIGY